ncbi:MAG: RlmI/RlmK family 23S rRNA methyltransferase, partial [Pseudomonadota bacterium]
MTDAARPILRLKPKADARRVRHGYPWINADDVVADRRTRGLPPGTVAVLQDAERASLGTVAVNMGARVAARMLDRDPGAAI